MGNRFSGTHEAALAYSTAPAKDFKVGENKTVSFETERAKKDITGEGDTKTKETKAKKAE